MTHGIGIIKYRPRGVIKRLSFNGSLHRRIAWASCLEEIYPQKALWLGVPGGSFNVYPVHPSME
jgi:hypothetical protein